MPEYYLYRHIRKDINQPFYIGIGKKTDYKLESINPDRHTYSRALDRSSRNKVWKKIVNQTDYEVEIMMEDDNREFICKKEMEFINIYGRLDDQSGVLCNRNKGGMLQHEYFTNRGIRTKTGIPTFIYKITGEFVRECKTRKEAAISLGWSPSTSNVVGLAEERNIARNGYRFFNEYQGEKVDNYTVIKGNQRPIIVINSVSKEVIKEYPNALACKKEIKITEYKLRLSLTKGMSFNGKQYKYKIM